MRRGRGFRKEPQKGRGVGPALRGWSRSGAVAVMRDAEADAGGGADGGDGQGGHSCPGGADTAAAPAGGAPPPHAPGPGRDAASAARGPGMRPHILCPFRGEAKERSGGCLRRGEGRSRGERKEGVAGADGKGSRGTRGWGIRSGVVGGGEEIEMEEEKLCQRWPGRGKG